MSEKKEQTNIVSPNTLQASCIVEQLDSQSMSYCQEFFRYASKRNGNVVQLDENMAHLPAIIGEQDKVVFLCQLVEEIDSVLDYNELQNRLSELSYGQIVAAVGFLRTLCQFNSKRVDIDELVDSEDESDPEFQNRVEASLGVRSNTGVLVAF